MTIAYQDALTLAIATAREAGARLLADLLAPGGPAGHGDHADLDEVVEWQIRERLLAATPGWGFLGEETGRVARAAGEAHCWLVDPNDGTRAYLRGERGSAVSIALLRDGRLVLGVVFAFAAPDNDGDLLAWAEGCGPLTRNGQPVRRRPWPTSMTEDTIVAISQRGDGAPIANLAAVAPGRYWPTASIAYRLALAAAGEVDLAATVNIPTGWDIAGGHALLLATGGMLVDPAGRPVTYTADGDRPNAYCFGGAPALAGWLAERYQAGPPRRELPDGQPHGLVRFARGETVADNGRLRRAQGCLLGQLAGDALGSLVEFKDAVTIRRLYPDGLRLIGPSPVWNTLAGQPTDDSEMALLLARTLLATGRFDAEAVASAYLVWYDSAPFDMGGTTRQALAAMRVARHAGRPLAPAARQHGNQASEANGALMRQSPLAIWGQAQPPERLDAALRADAALTHPNRVCADASAAFGVALAAVIRDGLDATAAYQRARDWDAAHGASPGVTGALAAARLAPPDYLRHSGHVLVALQNAFYQALHAPSFEAGVVASVHGGGDTDTDAAIAGALLGALHGAPAVPAQWRQAVLTCRPHASRPTVTHPRPLGCWPVDALILAERLLVAGHAAEAG